jgi:hypothetical protein
VAKRRGGVESGEHRAAGRLDVAFEPLDLLLGADMRIGGSGEDSCRLVAGLGCFFRRLAARLEGNPGRFAARGEIANLLGNLAGARCQRVGLVAVEFELLLAPVDVQFAGVRLFTNLRGALIRFRLLDAQP